jgi:hypothetical protein
VRCILGLGDQTSLDWSMLLLNGQVGVRCGVSLPLAVMEGESVLKELARFLDGF